MQNIKSFFALLSKAIRYLTENFKGVLLAIFILYLILPSGEEIRPANVARLNLTGPIMSSEKMVEKIDALTEDKNIQGVLVVINSPGGAVAPSIEISRAIKRLALIKPVISYAEGSLASGSYYASIWSTKIIANPGSLIGSIGVIFEGYNLENVMDKLGVSTQVVKAGKYKQVGTFNRKWTTPEKNELQSVISDMYELFVGDVAKARNLDITKKDRFADAHIFSAARAKSVGLIDEVATIYEAKQQLKRLTRLPKLIWQKPSFSETFLEQISSKVLMSVESYLLQPRLK